jgi:GntR family transcriptional regulator
VPDTSDSEFPYQRVAADLRAAILDGRRLPGDRVESEWDLAELYTTTRPTIRKAIAVLRGEGLVVSEQGKGTFVRPRPPLQLTITAANYRRHRATGLPGFNAQVIEQGQRPSQQLIGVVQGEAPAEVAARLGIETTVPVVIRKRLFLVDGEPVARCDSYFPLELVDGTEIMLHNLIRGGTARVIEDADGPIRRTVVRTVDDLTARMPTPDELAQLHLGAGAPVVRVIRTRLDAADVPVEVQDTVAAADRHTFRYEVHLG